MLFSRSILVPCLQHQKLNTGNIATAETNSEACYEDCSPRTINSLRPSDAYMRR